MAEGLIKDLCGGLKMMNNSVICLLDNGHGMNTPGKCSPDKTLLEYLWAREIVDRLIVELKCHNIKAVKLVPEDIDIPLRERVKRANKIYKDNNKKAILISIHCNAAGADGKWHTANGWSVFVAQNASSNSKRLARCLYEQAEKNELKGNRSVPKEKYWVQSLAICRDTNCPAVLTENMFQDNKEDVALLLSEEGKDKIVQIHVDGILNYVNNDR